MEILTPRRLKIANWLVLGGLVVAGFIWRGREFALGILVGGLVAVINFHLLHQALKGMLEQAAGEPRRSQRASQGFFCRQAVVEIFRPVVRNLSISRSGLGRHHRAGGGPIHRGFDPDSGRRH